MRAERASWLRVDACGIGEDGRWKRFPKARLEETTMKKEGLAIRKLEKHAADSHIRL